jgi:hypothetical protein
VVAGAYMKTWLPQIPSISMFMISGNVLYFGLSPFPGNLSGTLSDSKGHCSTKVTPAPLSFLSCSKGGAVPGVPLRAPYLTSHRHKLPDPQSADFGILLKASPPAYKSDVPHTPP